jgi:hypothetical protein
MKKKMNQKLKKINLVKRNMKKNDDYNDLEKLKLFRDVMSFVFHSSNIK